MQIIICVKTVYMQTFICAETARYTKVSFE